MKSASGYVLVVEDRDNWQEILGVLLENEGCEVAKAGGVDEASRKLEGSKIRNKPFNIAILDIRLNDKEIFNTEGLQLASLIRKDYKEIKIVLLTGYIGAIKCEIDVDLLMLKEDFNVEKFREYIRSFLVETTL